MKALYIAGPMTGLPEFNYPAFRAEATRLRALGFEVQDPSDNPEQKDWQGYLRVALTQMLTCDAVARLPGWEGSRGARLEVYVAEAIDMPVFEAASIKRPPFDGVDIDAVHRAQALREKA